MQALVVFAVVFSCVSLPASAQQDPNWHAFEHFQGSFTERAQTPDGWLVRVWNGVGYSVTYVPDPAHTWTPNPAPYALNPPDQVGHLVKFKVNDTSPGICAGQCFHYIWLNLDQIVEIEPSKNDPANATTITTTRGGPFNVADFDPTRILPAPPNR